MRESVKLQCAHNITTESGRCVHMGVSVLL